MTTQCDPKNDIFGLSGDITYSTIPVLGLDATVVDVKTGNDLPFKGFIAGAGLLIDETSNPGAITITATGAVQPYTYSTEVVPGITATVVGTQVGTNFGFQPVAGGGDVTVSNITNPGALTISSNVTFSTNVVPGVSATVVDTKTGSNLNFRGLIAGPNVTLDQVSQPGAIVISASGGSPAGQLFQNNTIFVDTQYGNNATGLRERRDLPFQTIAGALAVAQNFDTIHIFPGTYQETNTINVNLNIYMDDGVILTPLNANIFTVASVASFNISGHGVLSVPNAKVGISYPSNTASSQVEIENMNLLGLTSIGFDISNNFASTLLIKMAALNNAGIYIRSNIVGSNGLNIVSDIARTVTSSMLYSGLGQLGSLILNSEDLEISNSQVISFSGTAGKIYMNGAIANFNSSLVTGAYYFGIEDTTITASASNVYFSFDYDTIFHSALSGILLLRSSKPNGLDGVYPVAQFTSKIANHLTGGYNGNIFETVNGDVIITSGDLFFEFTSNNTGFKISGALTIDCSGTLKLINSPLIATLVSATNMYISGSDVYLEGPIVANNGFIKCKSLACSNVCSFIGNIAIDADTSSFINSSTQIFTVSAGTAINITGQKVTITSQVARAVGGQSGIFSIRASTLVFVNTGNVSSHILVTNQSSVMIEANYVENLSVSLTQSKCSVRCAEYVWNTAGGANIAFRNNSGSSVDFIASNISLTVSSPFGSIAWTSTSSSTLNLTATKLSVFSNFDVFELIGTPSPTTIANIDIQSIVLASSVASATLVTNSQGFLSCNFGTIESVTNNTAGIFVNTGNSSTFARIGYATIPCSLLTTVAGGNIVDCRKCSTTSNNPLIVLNGGTNEISGNYTTNGQNAIVLTGAPTVTIGPSKLFSTSNCILGPGVLPIGVIPSLANNPSAGVVVNGSLIVTTISP